MSPAHRVPTAVRTVVLALALSLGLLLGAPGRAEAATKAPSALSVASSSQTAVRLTWKPVSKAAAYQVKYATNAGFKKASSLRTTTPVVEISKLKPNKTYYFKVRALRSNGKALTTFSKKLKVKTRSRTSFSLLSPTGLAASAINGDELTLSWTAQGTGDRYRVRWSTVASMATPQVKDVSGTSALIDGLSTSTTYFFTVEALSAANLALSQPSAVFPA
ncbi:MAG: fibronectin type III domain-containing protein, partial [Propionicimonas sp.]